MRSLVGVALDFLATKKKRSRTEKQEIKKVDGYKNSINNDDPLVVFALNSVTSPSFAQLRFRFLDFFFPVIVGFFFGKLPDEGIPCASCNTGAVNFLDRLSGSSGRLSLSISTQSLDFFVSSC